MKKKKKEKKNPYKCEGQSEKKLCFLLFITAMKIQTFFSIYYLFLQMLRCGL
jgi:hypothetical protein